MASPASDPRPKPGSNPHINAIPERASLAAAEGGHQGDGSPGLPGTRAGMADRRLRFELQELALVASGAVPGALLRWQLVERLGPQLGVHSAANLLVNLVGCFLLGFLSGPVPHRTPLMLALGIGFCGSLTTFSGWILDLASLEQQGQSLGALVLLLTSLGLGLLAALGGRACSRRLFRGRQP